MKLTVLLIFLLMLSNVSLFLNAQQVNTLYYMQDVPVRHFLNPAFQPTTDYYISLPVIGFTQFSVGNNSLAFKDIIYNVKGKTISFLDSIGDIPLFYSKLKHNTIIQADFQTNILSFGFRKESAYWTFSLSEKIEGTVNLPKDIFKISLFGTTDPQKNLFNLTELQADISAYMEAAVGYSKLLDDKWTIGGKLKLLVGQTNISNSNKQFLFDLNIGKWDLKNNGTVNYSSPVQVTDTNNFKSFKILDWLKPSGIGFGIDLGSEYHLNKNIRLSGAIIDLGFIRWARNIANYQYGINHTLNGINLFNSNSTINTFQDAYNQLILKNALADTIVTAFKSSTISKLTSISYLTTTTAKVNLGFEYSLLNEKLSLGILSYSQIFNNIVNEEITGSVNSRPLKWLNASVSYSLFNGRMSNIGAGLGLKTGVFHWFLAADYVPIEIKTVPFYLGNNHPNVSIPIPYNSTTFNLSLGMNIVFDKSMNEKRGLVRPNKRQDCNCDWK